MKTFLQTYAINESNGKGQVIKNLTAVHKLELELQDIQKNVVDLYDRMAKYELDTKERNKIQEKITRFLREKEDIDKEMEYEMRMLMKSLTYIDEDGEINKFFE